MTDYSLHNSTHLRWFQVTPPGGATVNVYAANWLHAIGITLAAQGRREPESLASEVLSNGTALIRDVRRNETWLIRPLSVQASSDDALLPDLITEEIDLADRPGVANAWVL